MGEAVEGGLQLDQRSQGTESYSGMQADVKMPGLCAAALVKTDGGCVARMFSGVQESAFFVGLALREGGELVVSYEELHQTSQTGEGAWKLSQSIALQATDPATPRVLRDQYGLYICLEDEFECLRLRR